VTPAVRSYRSNSTARCSTPLITNAPSNNPHLHLAMQNSPPYGMGFLEPGEGSPAPIYHASVLITTSRYQLRVGLV